MGRTRAGGITLKAPWSSTHYGLCDAVATDEAGQAGGTITGHVGRLYLHGPGIDEILAEETLTSGGTSSEVHWTLGDHQGTIRDRIIVDANGTSQHATHVIFDAFGNIVAEFDKQTMTWLTAASVKSLRNPAGPRYGYTGRTYDADLGLWYYRARWYDSRTGRFTSEDPIFDDVVNTYRYVANDPVNLTDPSGLEPRYSGTFPVKGTGHHLFPVELWEFFGFADEIKKMFDEATLPTPDGHGGTAHGSVTGYTAHARAEAALELDSYLREKGIKDGKLTIDQQKDLACRILDRIRNTDNKFIKEFNGLVGDRARLRLWRDKVAPTIPAPDFSRLPSPRITGIARITAATRELAEAALKNGGRVVKAVPGGKYVILPAFFALMYNNARAQGYSPEEAFTIATVDSIHPSPIGLQEVLDGGSAAGKFYTDAVNNARAISCGEATEEQLRATDGFRGLFDMRALNRTRALERELQP